MEEILNEYNIENYKTTIRHNLNIFIEILKNYFNTFRKECIIYYSDIVNYYNASLKLKNYIYKLENLFSNCLFKIKEAIVISENSIDKYNFYFYENKLQKNIYDYNLRYLVKFQDFLDKNNYIFSNEKNKFEKYSDTFEKNLNFKEIYSSDEFLKMVNYYLL
jgi:hypothetical protein